MAKEKPAPASAGKAFKPDAATGKFWIFQEGTELIVLEGATRPEPPASVGPRKVAYLTQAPDRESLEKFIARQVKAFGVTVRQ